MDIIVGASEASVRAALRSELDAGGLSVALEVESPAALAPAVAHVEQPVLLSGVRWPEVAPFLERALACATPAALLLEEPLLDAQHPAFRQGATALLPWPIARDSLTPAFEAIGHGLRVVPGALTRAGAAAQAVAGIRVPAASLAPRSVLSPRERELLQLVAAGLGNKAIARTLGVSVNTVKYHLASAFVKLDARSRAEAVSAAARCGELML